MDRHLLHTELKSLEWGNTFNSSAADYQFDEDKLIALREKYIPILKKAHSSPDNTYLTDVIFNGFHPELKGRKLTSSDKDLIKEWKYFRSQHPRINEMDYLTDVLFYHLHPEMGGRKLTSSPGYHADEALIQEWKDIKNDIVLNYFGKKSSSTSGYKITPEVKEKLDQYESRLLDVYSALTGITSAYVKFLTTGTNVYNKLTGPAYVKYKKFSEQWPVIKQRELANNLLFNNTIPMVIEGVGIAKAAEVKEFLKQYNNGSFINTMADIMALDFPPPPGLEKLKEEKKATLLKLAQTSAQVYLDKRKPSAVQSGPEGASARGENVYAKPSPDIISFDLTGRFEYSNTADSSQPLMGMVICINQAGWWAEGVLSFIWYRYGATGTEPKSYYRFYAEFSGDKKTADLIFISGNDKLLKHKLQITFKTPDSISLNTQGSEIGLTRVKNKPILTERHFVYFEKNALVKIQQWFPLLTAQEKNIQSFFRDFTGYKKILPDNNFGNADAQNIRKQNLRELIRASAGGAKGTRLVDDTLFQFIAENFHESDREIAAFYIRHYLNQVIYDKGDGWELTLTSWIYRLLSIYENNTRSTSSPKAFLFGSRSSSGLGNQANKVFEYEISVQLYGLGAGFFIKGGYYRGSITIKCKEWEKYGAGKEANLKISLWELGGGIVAGLNFGQSFQGVSKSDVLWLPTDFIGSYTVGKAEAGVGAGFNVKDFDLLSAGVAGALGIMEINSKTNLAPMRFDIYSIDAPHVGGVSMEQAPIEQESKIGISLDITSSLGHGSIWATSGSTLPHATGVIKYGDEKAVLDKVYYNEKKQAHFKFDSALLTFAGTNLIRKICANELYVLMLSGTTVKITGNTDTMGDEAYNLDLSKKRAENVKQKIMDICGKKIKARIIAEGKGEEYARTKGGVKDGVKAPEYRNVKIEINGVIVITLIEG